MTQRLLRLAVGTAAIALIVSAAACSSTGPSPAASPSATGGAVSGKTAQNDKFLWTASKVAYVATVPDADGKMQKPSGAGKRFCLVTTTVKNLSSDDQFIVGIDYQLIDGTGDENLAVGLLTGDPDIPFLTQDQLPPGAEKTEQMIFEVPNNVSATTLVVGADDSKPGSGIKIALG